MTTIKKKSFSLPITIGDGRIDLFLKILEYIRSSKDKTELHLDWKKTKHITPAGFAIIAIIFDICIENKKRVKNLNISKLLERELFLNKIYKIDTTQPLKTTDHYDFENDTLIITRKQTSIDPFFTERIRDKFKNILSDDILYDSSIIINELMQNSVDHSTSERYYLYAGTWHNEFHLGVLDMGLGIPTKLSQKYTCNDDLEYLALSLKKGVGTRRNRPGGLGLFNFFELLKGHLGKLTIVSRNAQIRKYFKTRKAQKNILRYTLFGTWCFARFNMEKS